MTSLFFNLFGLEKNFRIFLGQFFVSVKIYLLFSFFFRGFYCIFMQ